MSKKNIINPLTASIGAAVMASALSMGSLQAAENPFAANALQSGFMLAEKGGEGKCGEGKCGESKGKSDEKGEAEGKCGEGKCGEGKCGEGHGKSQEGKCGEESDS